MKQPTKNSSPKKRTSSRRKKEPTVGELIKKRAERATRQHPKYGTSKLEDRFAKEFLDKLGLKYVRQFEAKDIKRFFDFMVTTEAGSKVLIEVDGDYFHGYGLLHENKNPMQKHSEWVDKHKDYWAHIHCIPIIRIWEHDINNNPSKVRKILSESLLKYDKETEIKNKKKQRGGIIK